MHIVFEIELQLRCRRTFPASKTRRMDDPFFLRLLPPPRPPARPPRRRTADPAVACTLASWVRSALHLPRDAAVELSEWVSMDCRVAPHTLHILVGTGHARRLFVVEKASERIDEGDVRLAVR